MVSEDYRDCPVYYQVYKKIEAACGKTFSVLTNVAAVCAVLWLVASHILGLRAMFVMSGSMEPRIRTHQIVIGRAIDDGTDLAIGDVCTYRPDGRKTTVTHRIIGQTSDGYVFKGDNNPAQDGKPVRRDQILYKLIWY